MARQTGLLVSRRIVCLLAGAAMVAFGLCLTGCGSLVRKAPVATAPAPIPAEAPEPAPAPDPAPPVESGDGCTLHAYAKPVSVHAYSRDGITIDDHLDISGCPRGGPLEMVVAGGCGTLKQVSGGGVRYYPPTREADAAGRVASDTLEIGITCPHGVKATARMRVTILHGGERPAVQSPPTGGPRMESEEGPAAGDPEVGAPDKPEQKGRLTA